VEIRHINSLVTVFIRHQEGANVGLIHTSRGTILIDTASSPAEIQALFEAAGASLDEVQLVINSHFHDDHTWGNQLFNCPIIAHRLCQEIMRNNLRTEWKPKALQSYLYDLRKRDQKKADELQRVIDGLHIKLPDRVFEDRFEGDLGGIHYEIIHLGGHTPDTSIIWLPEKKVLYASDLIFQGRYPYIFDADVPVWIENLSRLMEYKADVVIPGHGVLCGEAEIVSLSEYLRQTWELTDRHIHLGHSVQETVNDPAFPIFPGEKYERLHQANIRYIYNKLIG